MNYKDNIYNLVIDNLEKQFKDDSKFLNKVRNSKLHLGVFCEPYLDYMLKGKKTIESRFSKNKIAPYNKLNADDIILVKKSGGDIIGIIEIDSVLFFDFTNDNCNLLDIKNKYQEQLCVSDDFWISKSQSKYATLIFIKQIHFINPIKITKNNMLSWIVLN